jgi:RNA polymerase sigma factor for flagellar operon FliA
MQATLQGNPVDPNLSLWRDFKNHASPEAREVLINKYIYLAKIVVDRLNIRESGSMSKDDLISHAIIGLIDALERYSPSRGVKFESFALPRIRGSVIDMLRRMDWVPRSVRQTERSVKDAYGKLEAVLGRPATDEEVAEELGISPEAFHETLSDISQTSVFALEDCLQLNSDSDSSPAMMDLPGDAPDPSLMAETTERKRLLIEAIGKLPERERLVIGLYYYEGLTLKEIGKMIGVTEARVCQIHSKATLRLGGQLQRLRSVFVSS